MRALLAVVLLTLAAASARAEPIPTRQLLDVLQSLRGAHVLIEAVNRKPVVRVYRSAVGEPGQCFIFYATKTLEALNKTGYDLDSDFAMTLLEPGATENDCMTRPLTP